MKTDIHSHVDLSDVSSAALEGAMIYDQYDEKVGRISHGHGTGDDAHVIVDVSTFLGLGGKSVAIPVTALEVMRDDDNNLYAITRWHREQIEELPDHHHI